MASKQPKPDMFGGAPSVATKPAKKSKKDDRTVIDLGDNLDAYAAAGALMKALDGFQELFEGPMKQHARECFVSTGLELGTQPDNFAGRGTIDADKTKQLGGEIRTSNASVQLKKKAKSSPLSPEAVALLTKNNIPFDTVVEDPELYYFNPELLADPKVRAAISDALGGVPSLKGKQVILKQEPITKHIVSEDGIAAAFKTKDPQVAAILVDAQTTVAIMAKLENPTIENAVRILEAHGLTIGNGKKK